MTEPAIDLSSETCGDIARRFQATIRHRAGIIMALMAAMMCMLFAIELPHFGALTIITAGCLIPTYAWMLGRHPGLPVCPAIALQTYAIFALPIITRNEVLDRYPAGDTLQAALEILLFCLALTAGRAATDTARERPRAIKGYWSLSVVRLENPQKLAHSALVLIGVSSLFTLAQATRNLAWLEGSLPGGTMPIIRTAVEAGTMAAGLIAGILFGGRLVRLETRLLFWLLFGIYCFAKASSVLLSSALGAVAAYAIGHLIGARRPPWRFLLITACLAYFLNLGKFDMRSRYWDDYGYGTGVELSDMPAYFGEWSRLSWSALTDDEERSASEEKKVQLLTDRLNNMQNLLYVQDAIKNRKMPLLGGETYAAIPSLLIPRAVWKNKPRTHEGQILLNVHFGRQDLQSTQTTYIAWGLLAEAYGNFGAFWGALVCGLALGWCSGAMEKWIRPYPLPSLEAIFFLLVLVSLCMSFEMVASVWVSSLFQMMVALFASVLLFAEKRRVQPDQHR